MQSSRFWQLELRNLVEKLKSIDTEKKYEWKSILLFNQTWRSESETFRIIYAF